MSKTKPSEKLPGGPFSTADLVTYQDGAVISRTILQKKTGTVTLFAFDKDEELSEHTAPFDALLSVLDGQATISIHGKPHSVSAGETILLPANLPHAVHATRRFKMLLIMIKT